MKMYCSKEMVREDLLYSSAKEFFWKAMLSINENEGKVLVYYLKIIISSLFDPVKYVVMLNKYGA